MAFGNLADVTSTLIILLEANINGHLQQALGPDVTRPPGAARPHRAGSAEPAEPAPLSRHRRPLLQERRRRRERCSKYREGADERVPLLHSHRASQRRSDRRGRLAAAGNDGHGAENFARQPGHHGSHHDPQSNGPGIQILPANLRNRGNSIQVILRPVSPEDAVGFWATEDQQLTTLSAYYEVRVIFLEPELPRTVPGIVLSLGAYLQQLGSPDLRTSASTTRFTLPAIAGGGQPPPMETAPARAVLDDRPNPPAENRRFRLLGTNLAIGRSRKR